MQQGRLLALIFLFFLAAHCFALRILVVSDLHYAPSLEKTRYAELGRPSDSGRDLYHSLQRELRKHHPDAVVLLGDLPGHQSLDQLRVDRLILKKLPTLFPHTPFFYLPGNEDSPLGDYHSFSAIDPVDGGLFSPSLYFKPLKNLLINDGSYQHHPFYFGYYSAYLTTRQEIRLIALNTVIMQNPRDGKRYVADDGVSQDKAAGLEFAWLQQQLEQAKQRRQSVILAMHIPAGFDVFRGHPFWSPRYKKRFMRLLHRYRQQVLVVLTAHTHMNELRLYKHGKQLDAVAVGVPGVTPLHRNDPGFDELVFAKRGQWYLDAKQSLSYRYAPRKKQWGRYTNFALCDVHQAGLAKLAQICPFGSTANWVIDHYAQGNPGFKFKRGKQAVITHMVAK